MSFDGIFTHLMIEELKPILLNGRINKLHQPYPNEVVLVIRSQGKNHKLLLSAHPSYARIQLTTMTYANPDTPPNFIMMLRKYLEGAILTEISQLENDRVVHFTFSKRDELGDLQSIVLVVELMGRHSTILLLNQETGKILDAIKHIGSSQNSYRWLIPGADYIAPPKQEKENPYQISELEAFHLLSKQHEFTAKSIQALFQGFGRDTAEELAYRLNKRPQERLAVWQEFYHEISTLQTSYLVEQNQKEAFHPFRFISVENQADALTAFTSLNELLDAFYHEKAEKDRVKQQGSELVKKIENELKRNQLKLKKREETLAASASSEELRQKGELLTTFQHNVTRGVDTIDLPNYYIEDQPTTIALDPSLTPIQNAQKYFQKYQKLRNAVKLIDAQIAETKQEIAYLESVLSQLELAQPFELPLIKEELIAEGYIKRPTKQVKRQEKKSQPSRYYASDGTELLVGKNNLQNDQLTLRTAKKTDYWLHAKNIPGSHVIIRSDDPSEETILEAAELAGYFSKYRHSAQVPIDCVQVKHIKKPNGAKPGFVIYENQTAYFVTPEEAVVAKLAQKPIS
ncbi:fibronectin-binding protein EfbA [Enterococcus bulliens]